MQFHGYGEYFKDSIFCRDRELDKTSYFQTGFKGSGKEEFSHPACLCDGIEWDRQLHVDWTIFFCYPKYYPK